MWKIIPSIILKQKSMYKGMINETMERYCEEVANRENNGMPEQLKHFKYYKSRGEKLNKKK